MHRRLALIADDCPLTRALHAEILGRAGFRTVAVASGTAAAQEVRRVLALDSPGFDLVLLDYDMPGGDGPCGARMIRASEAGHRRAPMYCVSSHPAERIGAICLAAGFDGLLGKPLTLDAAMLARLAPEEPEGDAAQPASARPGRD